nr:MAG TPA: hypothetical protein [Caudoviricetes sp.]
MKVDLRRDIIMLSKYRRTMTNSVVVLFYLKVGSLC